MAPDLSASTKKMTVSPKLLAVMTVARLIQSAMHPIAHARKTWKMAAHGTKNSP
jgi:hypothetical protein